MKFFWRPYVLAMDKFTVLGFVITSVGSYLASLTSWGFLVVAIGGGIFLYGQRRDSGSDVAKIEATIAAKVAEVRQEIASAKEAASSPEEVERLDDADKGFRDWAAKIVENKERSHLEMERTRLEEIESQLKRSDVWRPVLELFLATIARCVKAYGAETGSPVAVDIPRLPTNLFDVSASYTATVVFNSKVTWVVELDRTKTVLLSSTPVLCVQRAGSDMVRLAYLWSSDLLGDVRLTVQNERLKRLKGVEGDFSFKSYQSPLQAATQRLVEAQILALDS